MKVLCPQCKVNTVERLKPVGRFPICDSCKKDSWEKLLAVQRDYRKSGRWQSHYNKDGVRYGQDISSCSYCAKPFYNKIRGAVQQVCPKCSEIHKADLYSRKRKRAVAEWSEKSDIIKRLRLESRLGKMGLNIEWYDSLPKVCGICGTTKHGAKGWCIDHDHSCCPTDKFCPKCVRGLLCTSCNMGLGQFKDNTTFLKNAIEWLERHRGKSSVPDYTRSIGYKMVSCSHQPHQA